MLGSLKFLDCPGVVRGMKPLTGNLVGIGLLILGFVVVLLTLAYWP